MKIQANRMHMPPVRIANPAKISFLFLFIGCPCRFMLYVEQHSPKIVVGDRAGYGFGIFF